MVRVKSLSSLVATGRDWSLGMLSMITALVPRLGGYPQNARTAHGRAPKGKISEPIRQARDRLTGQPQERQHRARVAHAKREGGAGTWDRLPPARATIHARGIVTGRPRPDIPLAGSAGAR